MNFKVFALTLAVGIGYMAGPVSASDNMVITPYSNLAQSYINGLPVINVPVSQGNDVNYMNIPGYVVGLYYRPRGDILIYEVKHDNKEIHITTNTDGSSCRTIHDVDAEPLFVACFK